MHQPKARELLAKVRALREGSSERWGAEGSFEVTPEAVAKALDPQGDGARVDYEVDANGKYVVFGEEGTFTLSKQEFGTLRRLTKVRLSRCPNGVGKGMAEDNSTPEAPKPPKAENPVLDAVWQIGWQKGFEAAKLKERFTPGAEVPKAPVAKGSWTPMQLGYWQNGWQAGYAFYQGKQGGKSESKVQNTPEEIAAVLTKNGLGKGKTQYYWEGAGQVEIFVGDKSYTLDTADFARLKDLVDLDWQKESKEGGMREGNANPHMGKTRDGSPEDLAKELTTGDGAVKETDSMEYWRDGGKFVIYWDNTTWEFTAAEFEELKSRMGKTKWEDVTDEDVTAEGLIQKVRTAKGILENDEEGRFEKGATVRVKPTPEAQKKTYPAADWITKEMEVTLEEPCVAGGLDVVDVSGPGVPEDASIYAFNIIYP